MSQDQLALDDAAPHLSRLHAGYWNQRPTSCPRRVNDGEYVHRDTGELRPLWCNVNSCPFCGRVRSQWVARAIGAAQPDRELTFTQVGDEWHVIRSRMKKLKRNLRRSGYCFEWSYTVECNGVPGHACRAHRVHALAHGEVPDEAVLSLQAHRVGFGHVVRNVVVRDALAAAFYMTKTLSKCLAIDRPHQLWINGGTFEHSSRGYWRIDGKPVGGRNAAVRAIREKRVIQITELKSSD